MYGRTAPLGTVISPVVLEPNTALPGTPHVSWCCHCSTLHSQLHSQGSAPAADFCHRHPGLNPIALVRCCY